MEAMRESWTDERLDDGFDRVDGELRAIRTDMGSFRVEMKERFDRVENRIEGLDRRFTRQEGRIEGLGDRFDGFEHRFDRFEDRVDRWQRITVSILGSLAIALLTIVLSQA